MIHKRIVTFVAETIHEKAVLHHYEQLFTVYEIDHEVPPSQSMYTEDRATHHVYHMDERDWSEHCHQQSELWLAIRDPELAASDLKHRVKPHSEKDLGHA